MNPERDDRFAVINHDPRFRKIPRRERKVKIDKRFHGMFKDEGFKLKYTVDKRGRPVSLTSDKHLRKFYELSSSEDEESDEDDEVSVSSTEETRGGNVQADQKSKRLSGRQKVIELLKKRKERRPEWWKTPGSKTPGSKTPASKTPGSKTPASKTPGSKTPASKTPASKTPGSKTLSKNRAKTTARIEKQSVQDDDADCGDSDQDSSDSSQDEPPLRSPLLRARHKGRSVPQEVDLARGQGNVESSSDSDSDSDYGSSDREDGEEELQWGELDRDAQRSADQSSRLALCNMDWDRVTANDLLVLFNSFKPTGGVVHSVKIYPSDYGLEKMQQEDAMGPAELGEAGGKDEEISAEPHNDDMLQKKLRKYQLQRLKYYYAVIECDTDETASAVYDHCDGMEYQSSSTKLDLRFIPNDVTFDHEPKEVVSELPDTALYKPIEFRTKALHQSRVELTWDETNHQRTIKTAEAFKKKNIEEMDVSAFLASSSDEDGEERWELDFNQSKAASGQEEEECNISLSEDQHIAKYRALLKEVEKDHQMQGDKQMEIEITWEPGLKETTEDLVKKKSEKAAEATPWEKFLEKKKKKKQKGLKDEIKETAQNDELAFSDDELPPGVDLNDSYFRDALKEDGVKVVKKSKKTGDRKEEEVDEDKEKIQQNKSELELLFMDNDDGKKHFNLKQIMESEKSQGKKAKRKKRRQQEETLAYQDDFQVDVTDHRFQAMFTSHLYAMDPSNPQFKKTKATEALLAERQRRRQREEEQERLGVATTTEATPITTSTSEALKPVKRDAELSMLVKSVKNKTDQFKERKLKWQKVR